MFIPSERTAYSHLVEHATIRPDDKACFSDFEATTWGESLARVNALVKLLHDAGIEKGAYVALRAVKTVEAYHLFFALLGIGALTVVTDQFKGVDEAIAETGKHVPLAFAITSENGAWELVDYKRKLVLPLPIADAPPAEQAEVDTILAQANVHEACLLLFTSGSTKVSKGVLLSQYALVNNARNVVYTYENYRQDDVPSLLTPLHHIFAIIGLLLHIVSGSTLFLAAHSSPAYVLERIERYRLTTLDTVPVIFLALCELQRKQPRDVSSLRHGAIAGGPCSPKQLAYIEEQLGITLWPSYGMTEAAPFITITKVGLPAETRYDCVGEFITGIEHAIKNGFGMRVAQGETGEICVKGYNLMLGYYDDEEANRAAFDEEGFFHTGDLGYMDENGRLHVVDRLNGIIIRGGDNLSPAKIEQAIASVAGVRYVAVVGIPDEYYGEIACAAVVADGLDEWTLREALKDRLRKIELPTKLLFMEELPLTKSGKPDKVYLKKLFQKTT